MTYSPSGTKVSIWDKVSGSTPNGKSVTTPPQLKKKRKKRAFTK